MVFGDGFDCQLKAEVFMGVSGLNAGVLIVLMILVEVEKRFTGVEIILWFGSAI